MLDRRRLFASLSGLFALPAFGARSPKKSGVAEIPWPADGDPRYWEKLRGQFLLREDEVFFNTATLGTPARVVVEPSRTA